MLIEPALRHYQATRAGFAHHGLTSLFKQVPPERFMIQPEYKTELLTLDAQLTSIDEEVAPFFVNVR
ncbi:MAG: hypothetical protein DYG88_11425 [Chloroflexi bacterium CFX4]|nr:hypothetical protein [Chloroflexi bacterium CFX4]MDL1922985.1 hypothetical protein [Chloroflexi bacterium CFX3]